MSLLDKINTPDDLKKLSVEELPRLAGEIRQKIVEVVFKNGGHLGSNLGVVELTIALHYVFDFKTDRLIWDVSHQAYTHKILTGRRERFDSLRQAGGLSGFTSPAESEYDVVQVGHAGTSISVASGIACGMTQACLPDRQAGEAGKPGKVVAVLGDGALTCGMTFEALNHAGTLKKDMLVILNDNRMSISYTIGAMSKYLNKLRTASIYDDVKKEVYQILEHLPVAPKIGTAASRAFDHLRAAAVATLGGFIFEELGWAYYGPIDGHNISKLIQIIKEIQRPKLAGKPVILHIITEKGRGSVQALSDPYRFHGIGPVNLPRGQAGLTIEKVSPGDTDGDALSPQLEAAAAALTANTTAVKQTYTEVFGKTIVSLAREDKKVVAITAAMPEGTGLVEFEHTFPDRYFDVGICEQHAVGFASGLVKSGLKPVVAIYSTFLQRAFDQLFQEIALQYSSVPGGLPQGIVFSLDRAGLVGNDGPTHHGVFDIAYTRIFPDFILMAPKDGAELSDMLAFALTQAKPVVIRYPRTAIPECGSPEATLLACHRSASGGMQNAGGGIKSAIQLGKAEILREGNDGAIVAYGSMVYPALGAAEMLSKEGRQIMVVNARFAKPLDESLLARLSEEQPFLATIEEHSLTGGFGSAVMETLNRLGKGIPRLIQLGIPDRFVEHGSREQLLAVLNLSAEGISRKIKSYGIHRRGAEVAEKNHL